jgi:steroid delta-isomerase-like uncharacterized protein
MRSMSQQRSLARRYFEDLFNAGDLAVAAEILHPDITFDGPIHPVGIRGLDAFRVFARSWYSGFPDRQFTIVDEWVEPGRIATQFTITGTHRGEFLGQAGTDNPIEVRAMNVMQVADGRIRAIRAYFNPLELLYPIGLAPSPNALDLTGPTGP